MRLVERHTNVPVPSIMMSSYGPEVGGIGTSLIPGVTLSSIWDGLDAFNNEWVCREIWSLIMQRRQIPGPPPKMWFTSISALLMALHTHETHCLRISKTHLDPSVLMKRYGLASMNAIYYSGRQYADTLPSMLPRSEASTFTHGDVCPAQYYGQSE